MLEILIGKWVILKNSKEKNLKSLLLFFVFLPFVSFSQEDCKELKFGWNKIKVCDLHQFKKLDPDSIAKAHLMINDRIYMATVPSDSLLKAHAFYYQFPQLGENTCVVSSTKQSKNKRVIGVVNPDYSTSMIMYKNGIRNGKFSVYRMPVMLVKTGNYKNGLEKGYFRFWDETGMLIEIKKFKNGIEKESFTGKKLKSLRLFRFGPKISYGIQTIDAKNINNSILNNNSKTIPDHHLTLNYGFEGGNTSSLSILAYQNIILGNGSTTNQLNGFNYGGKLYYTFYQTKKRNFRLGAGAESGRFYYKNTTEITFPGDEYLAHSIIKNNKAMNLDFSFQWMSRKFIFKKKTNTDIFFSGMEIGYVLPVNEGVFKDINNNSLGFTTPPFNFSGFHFSIFILVPTF